MRAQRRRRPRRALSTIIGGTFFVAIAILSLNILVWQLAVYDLEFENARLRSQVNSERFEEKVDFIALTVSNSKLNGTLKNDGIFLVHLIGVWITEYQTPPTATWHRRFQLNQRINAERTVTNIGQELSQALSSTYTYVVKFITANGNVIVGIYSPIGTLGKTGVSTTGYLFFSFSQENFKMTNQTQSSPVSAWVISPGSQQFVWHMRVDNHGLYDIKLYKYSVLSFVRVEKSTSVTQTQFYIVNPASNNTSNVSIYVDLSQTIPANPGGDYDTGGSPTWVKFSAQMVDPGPSQLVFNWNAQTQSEYMVFMIFYYRYGTTQGWEDLTQIIPFVGVLVR